MGWWQGNAKNTTVGDEPADLMTAVLKQIKAAYQRDLKRSPTKTELRETLEFVMHPKLEE